MESKEITEEYNKRINEVINFILSNLNDDLSLQQLAAIANYSPFHFQKIFKNIMGESPKQYIIRMRLEHAAHTLRIHSKKTITEISFESGFTSPSIFSRAFKNYFGVSAEELKKLTPKENIQIRQKINLKQKTKKNDLAYLNDEYNQKFWENNLHVTIKKIGKMRLIYLNAPLTDTAKIQNGYKQIALVGSTNDLSDKNSQFIGVINPHQGLYRTSITIDQNLVLPKKVDEISIDAGKFATFKIKGDSIQTFHGLHAFFQIWIPESGYRIANQTGFEILLQNPTTTSYNEIEREIYISIEPI